MSKLPGFYFRKSWKLLPGVKFNLSKTGFSVSLGPDAAHITTGTHGTFLYLNLPGSGTYYRRKISALKSDSNGHSEESEAEKHLKKLDLNFFDRLINPEFTVYLADSLKHLLQEDYDKAYREACKAIALPDGAFLAGMLAIHHHDLPNAEAYLTRALDKADGLGQHFEAFEVDAHMLLPITHELAVQIMPGESCTRLALAETYQESGQVEKALDHLWHLHEQDPHELVIRLSLAETLYHQNPDNPDNLKRVISLAEGVHNAGPVHAALMLYRARALRQLGLLEGARDTLSKALRRRKGYPEDLLIALRYERAVLHQMTGEEQKARKDLEKIYAQMPDYEDVAARLGL